MTRVFTWEFDVRSYEQDAYGHVNNAVYSNYFEEGATRASADAGFAYDWYFTRKEAWVIRQMTIRYLSPLHYRDRVVLKTWVSDFKRIYSHREYDLRRKSDDNPVARGRAKWVYVNLETMRPQRIPAEMEAAFDPSGKVEDLGVRLHDAEVFEDAPHFASHRRVQHYELDPAGHVNNAVYLNWFEQAMFEALAGAGWPVARMQEIGLGMTQAGHIVDYLRPALDREPMQITSQPVALSGVRGVWQHEVCQAESGEVVARDYSVGVFLDLTSGKPCKLPDVVLNDILNGQ